MSIKNQNTQFVLLHKLTLVATPLIEVDMLDHRPEIDSQTI